MGFEMNCRLDDGDRFLWGTLFYGNIMWQEAYNFKK